MYEIMALTQANWEDQFSKKEVNSRIKKALFKDQEFMESITHAHNVILNYYIENNINMYPSKFTNWTYLINEVDSYNILMNMFVLITLNKYTQIQTIVGQLFPLLEKMDMIPAIKTLSEMLVVVAEHTDLWNVYTPSESEEGVITVEANYSFDEDILQYLADIKYLPPMLIRPKMVNCNYDYDYLNTPSSKILGSGNHHNEKISLDVINIMNGIKLKLDTFMLQYEEVPNKELDTIEKVEQFNRMVTASKKVYKAILDVGGKFYLTHKYDKRGRLYSQGYHINIQSTDYKKSLISLAEGEYLDNF